MPRTIQAEGRLITVPDDATPAEINKIVGPAASGQPGISSRFTEATGIPTSRAAWEAAQPSRGDVIRTALIGPAYTAGKQAVDYGKNLVSEGRKAVEGYRQPGGDINIPGTSLPRPLYEFMTRGVLGPMGGTGVSNLGRDIESGNLRGATGDALGTFLNALMLRKSFAPSEKYAVNKFTAATDRNLRMPFEKTIPELRESAADIGRPNSPEGFYSVAQNAADTIQREANAAMAPIAQRLIFPRAIADNIRKLITPDMKFTREGRAEINHINAEAKKFENVPGNQPWTYEALDSKRMRLNSELSAFEKKGEGARYTAAKGNLNTAIDKTVANTIRDVIYPQMDQAVGRPPGYFRGLKQKQGNLMEIADELNPRNRKGVTEALKGQTAEIQGSSRFKRENMSLHVGGKGLPRASAYGLTNIIRKQNPLRVSGKQIYRGFNTGNPAAKAYTSTLPFRSQLFPNPQEENR